MEIVFEPDLFDGEEAASLIKELMMVLEVQRDLDVPYEEKTTFVKLTILLKAIGYLYLSNGAWSVPCGR